MYIVIYELCKYRDAIAFGTEEQQKHFIELLKNGNDFNFRFIDAYKI